MKQTFRRITAVLLLAAVVSCSACNLTRVFDLERDPRATEPAAPYVTAPYGTAPYATAPYETTAPQVTVPQVPATTVPVPTTQAPPASQLSVQEVVSLYADALNRTRAYQGTLNVHHTETFSGSVVEAQPLGALTTRLANTLVGMIGDPVDDTLTFTGGMGVNEEGEAVPILLPKKGAFSLPMEGVRNAFADTANGMRHVVINLVAESVGFGGIPPYNAGAVGYLDTASLDFKIIKINSCTITYTGSVIDAYIRDDGYIASVNYTINLSVEGSVTGLGITGSGVMEGVEYESWELLW